MKNSILLATLCTAAALHAAAPATGHPKQSPRARGDSETVLVVPEDEKKIEALVGTRLTAVPAKPRKVLMLALSYGYRHKDAMAYGLNLI